MEPNKPKTSALDFFLHLGVVVSLYAVVSFLLNLLFRVINVAFPGVNSSNYYSNSSISLPVAALIVLFPVFILLSALVNKSYAQDEAKKHLGVRKWLTYLTLFVTGSVIAGDLITVIYYFLDGRDFTAAFVYKALSVLLVTAIVFKYYFFDLKDKMTPSGRKRWAIIGGVVILVSVVFGFSVIGSPSTQRKLRFDEQRVSDLQNIQSQLVNYWQKKGSLPDDLSQLNDPLSYFTVPIDPESKSDYVYTKTGSLTFKLCANFDQDSLSNVQPRVSYPNNENWQYKAGEFCFDRSIDPGLYPINPPVKAI